MRPPTKPRQSATVRMQDMGISTAANREYLIRRLLRPAWGSVMLLQTLLIAERAALLTGREDDFTLILTLACTGLRWGEIISLEHGYLHPGEIRVEWQIREVGGWFYRLPPKDDTCRSPDWEPCFPVDLPPFLATLLARQAAGSTAMRCACAAEHGGSVPSSASATRCRACAASTPTSSTGCAKRSPKRSRPAGWTHSANAPRSVLTPPVPAR